MRSFLALLAAVNPPAVAVALWPRERARAMAVAAAVAGVVAVGAAAISGPFLEAIDVSPPTFQVAAAIVLGLASARPLIAGSRTVADEGPPDGWARVAVPLLIPVLLTPQLVAVSVSVGADDGVGIVAAGAATGLVFAAVGAVVPKRRRVAWDAGVRFVAGLAIAIALALAVDGVKTI